MKTLLGIDYGARKIGLAIAPADSSLAVPFRVLREKNEEEALLELVKICKEEDVEKIIIGIPESSWTGEKSEKQTKPVREFIKKLEQSTFLSVEEINERASSKQAQRLLIGQSKDTEDAVAAMIILQSYLDRKNNNT